MSKDLPQPQQSEEVDLGQLFKLIGKAFDRLFKFIGGVFNKLFLGFVWLVFFVKRNIIILLSSIIIGGLIGFAAEKFSPTVFKSYVTVKQNYNTGENLYTSIAYYKELINKKDTETLKNALGLTTDQAESILDFDIESVVSENDRLKDYNDYLKTLDSTLASTVDYEEFKGNTEDYLNIYQQIIIKAKKKNNFKLVFDKIVSSINNNEYFKREQQKDLQELKGEEEAIMINLRESDSLQQVYKRVLEYSATNNKPSGSQMSVNIDSGEDKQQTKEYDLFKNDSELRQRLVTIKRKIADKQYVLEVISNKQDSGVIYEGIDFLGFELGKKKYYAILVFIATLMTLLGIRFLKFLDKYKGKV